MLDCPDPESPGNHTVAPESPWRSHRTSRATVDACQTTSVMSDRPDRVDAKRQDPSHSAAAGTEHPGRHRLVGRFVDEDEAPGGAVAPVVVGEQRRRGPQGDAPDLVEPELGRL